jgi:hypothetical protein
VWRSVWVEEEEEEGGGGKLTETVDTVER